MSAINSTTGQAVGNGGPAPGVTVVTPDAQPDSLRSRLAAKRQQLQAERTIVLPVPGYAEDGLHARYRGITYEELRKITKRHERHSDTPEGEVAQCADILILACTGLLEKTVEAEYHQVAERWSPEAARDLFGIDLPDEATSRQALFAIFPNDGGLAVLLHYRRYDQWLGAGEAEIDKAVASGSEAS